MRWVLKFLGLPIIEISSDEAEAAGYAGGSGGQFELLAPSAEEGSEYSPDDPEGFGLRSPR
jgi:hypothetical protein